MYVYFQPRISVAQEEADIKEMIDKEYEQREQEHIDYYKQMEEDYYRYLFQESPWTLAIGWIETNCLMKKYFFFSNFIIYKGMAFPLVGVTVRHLHLTVADAVMMM